MTIERRSPKRPRGAGSLVTAHCTPCGHTWQRYFTSVQPCPSCGEPVNMLPVRAAQTALQKRHAENLRAQAERIGQIARASAEREREREKAERDEITVILRQARDDAGNRNGL